MNARRSPIRSEAGLHLAARTIAPMTSESDAGLQPARNTSGETFPPAESDPNSQKDISWFTRYEW